jgi:hypothetical protein
MMTYADLLASADARAWQNQGNAQNQQGITNQQWNQQFDWTKRLGEAGQTGMWNGAYNMPSQQYFAGAFGTWMPGGPQAGQQTLQAQQQQFGQGLDTSQLYGQYYAPGTAPTQGAQTLAGQQQQWQQGFNQQQFAAQQQQLQQQNAMGYLGLLSNLRGPADWAKYQQVLGSTPNGMRDLAAAAMGQYVPGGGATTGVAPQAANLNSMYAQIQGSPNTYAYPQQQNWGQQAQNYINQNAQAQPLDAGQTWGTGIGVGGNQATPAQAVQATGNGTNLYGAQPQQYNLPAPNQIAAQSWQNMAPSQQQMLLGQYESQGWDKGDVQALYNQSLPKYGSNNASAGTWRLQ